MYNVNNVCEQFANKHVNNICTFDVYMLGWYLKTTNFL